MRTYIDLLQEKQLISPEMISDATSVVNEKGISFEEALLSLGLSDTVLRDIKAEFFGVPARNVDLKLMNSDLFKYIPEESAILYKFTPIAVENGILIVGIIDPDNSQAKDALQFITAKADIPFKICTISYSDFQLALKAYRGITGEVDEALQEMDTELQNANDAISDGEDKDLKDSKNKIVEDAPVIKIVAVILRHAIEGNASDIHIENNGEKVNVRFRVDGSLHTSLILPLSAFNGVVARIKILSKLRLDEKRKPQDGSFSTKIDGRKIDFRVSTLPTYFGEKVVLRILDSERGIKPLEALGFTDRNLKLVRDAIDRPYGLILITGPTGSGKTTTLYSMLNEVDREKMNVVSLEDPVEYNIPSVNQSQVMAEIGYTFASGLRSILRQDPDVILVGEIRDKETAQLAIQAALTGHLVFSTLHTNNAAGVVPRLIDMGVDPYLIAPTLVLSVAQRLVRHTCPTSKKETPMSDVLKEQLNKYFSDLPEEYKKDVVIPEVIYDTVSTPDCPSGTRGRIAVHEMFKIDREMQKLILQSPGEDQIYQLARKQQGMLTMREDGFIKSLKGETPMSEVYGLADNRE
jgi:type IV pilus assembly protein PilB